MRAPGCGRPAAARGRGGRRGGISRPMAVISGPATRAGTRRWRCAAAAARPAGGSRGGRRAGAGRGGTDPLGQGRVLGHVPSVMSPPDAERGGARTGRPRACRAVRAAARRWPPRGRRAACRGRSTRTSPGGDVRLVPQPDVPPRPGAAALAAVEGGPHGVVRHVRRGGVGVELLLGLPVLDDVVRPRRRGQQDVAEQSAAAVPAQLAQHARHGEEDGQPVADRPEAVDAHPDQQHHGSALCGGRGGARDRSVTGHGGLRSHVG